jgi:hypothetical protein
MIKSAAVTSLLIPLLAVTAYAEGDAPQTTTAGTLVVVTPNAPIVVTNNANAQVVGGPSTVQPQGAAEMPPVPPPPGPPQNEDWNNVSHINGMPVPVGTKTDYLYSFKKTNISSNPIAWMFGYYQVAAAHALSNNVAVSVELSAWDTSNGNQSGYQLAATLPIYFKKTYSGPFLEGGLVIHNDNHPNYTAYDCYDCSTTSTNSSWVGPEVMFGWSWMFDSGLNVAAAFGAAKQLQASNMSSSSEPIPAGYFRVGYAF